MKVSDEVLEEIIEKIDKGASIEDASNSKGIKSNHVRRYLFTRKGEKGKKILMEELESKIPIYDILRIYQDDNNKKFLSEIADDFGIPLKEITESLKMYELLTGKTIDRTIAVKNNMKLSDSDKKKMIKQYKSGVTVKELMLIYSCSESTVRRAIKKDKDETIKKHKISYEKRKNKSKILLPVDEIVEEKNKGKKIEQIANSYGVSNEKIKRMLKEQEEKRFPVMIKELEKGKSIEDVATENNIKPSKLRKKLINFGITRGLNILIKDSEQQLPMEEILDGYKTGKVDLVPYLSNKYGIDKKELLDKIKEYKNLIMTKKYREIAYSDPTKKKEGFVIYLYKKGDSLELIYNKCEFARSRIKKILKNYTEEYGEEEGKKLEKEHTDKIHKLHPSRKKISLPVENIVRLYRKNLPLSKIAQFYGVSSTTIKSRLQEYYKSIGIEEKNIER